MIDYVAFDPNARQCQTSSVMPLFFLLVLCDLCHLKESFNLSESIMKFFDSKISTET